MLPLPFVAKNTAFPCVSSGKLTPVSAQVHCLSVPFALLFRALSLRFLTAPVSALLPQRGWQLDHAEGFLLKILNAAPNENVTVSAWKGGTVGETLPFLVFPLLS